MLGLKIAVFAFATCATPGPVNILASISGANNGLRANVPFVLGATAGLSLVILVAGFGVSQLLKTNTYLANALVLVGSGYMLYLASRMARSDTALDKTAGEARIPGFYQGSVLQIINPKAWLVSMAGAALYLNREEYLFTLALYVSVFFLVCFVSVYLWVGLGRLIATRLQSKHLSLFNKSMAGVLVTLVVYNLYDTFAGYGA
ncbi:LysE family translocator [Marinobacter sp. X15-166B]|uniref:LysE family translocator n=1 Tax=Marinobacter sp. X15-166B TaxID=1897620 RepID=UPI00114D015F|nr:LysE family translocator [Marinobacter sp. X15-166B]